MALPFVVQSGIVFHTSQNRSCVLQAAPRVPPKQIQERAVMFTNVVVVLLLSVVASDDGSDISPALSSGNRESKVMFDSIDAMIRSSFPENRNYPAIMQQIVSLSDTFPDSRETITMLETLEMWRSLGHISGDQYSPFEKKLSEFRSAEERGVTFFAGIERQYQKYLSSKDADALERIIKSCQDVLDVQNSSKKMKCYALLCLAQMHLEKNDVGKSESYLLVLSELLSSIHASWWYAFH